MKSFDLLVIGSGVIGTEFAFILSTLGRDVVRLTQAEAWPQRVQRVRQALNGALGDVGVAARARSRVFGATAGDDGVILELPDGSREAVDWVLLGAGAGELVQLLSCAFGEERALARLAAVPYNHPVRSGEILNAVETLAACWGLADKVFGGAQSRG